MSGSVGRLKAVVEIVGREVVRELRKNQFFNYLGGKGKIGDRTIVLQFILVKRFFLEERCNKSKPPCLFSSGSFTCLLEEGNSPRVMRLVYPVCVGEKREFTYHQPLYDLQDC